MSERTALAEALAVDRGGFQPAAAPSPFVALQRVVVRMLFDPAFVARVYEAPERALAGLDLTHALVRQLVANDRRLWNADRLRRQRALHVLLEEFKVSSTLALAESRRLALLDDFFSSTHFHDAVQQRGYMALAFADYLGELLAVGTLGWPHLVQALRLESAMVRSRRLWREAARDRDAAWQRARELSAADGRARTACQPGVSGVFLATGTIGLVQHVEKYLFQASQVPALALCDDAPRPEPLPPLDHGQEEAYLLEPEPGGKVELSSVPAPFIHVVQVCQQPLTDQQLVDALRSRGLAPADARDYVEQLLEGEVLRRSAVQEGR